ncbi:MAG TPA: hypothetical protein VK605_01755 [Solirubrobacteraceae bacterium]|nr:hypothetical protein [Solirubrobacteraceae bacterium]
MFASAKTSTLAQRTLGALRLTRSFLLLEDDHDVDWEVDRDEELTQTHPHRMALRGPGRRSRRAAPRRRPGEGAPAQSVCISPVNTTPGEAPASRERPPCAQTGKRRAHH